MRFALYPFNCIWSPQQGENVVGVIDEAKLNTYNVNLHSPYKGVIISKYAEGGLSNGDIIEATVRGLDKTGVAVLVRPRVLRGGKLISIKPSKIPRVLGRGNTMIKQISDYTKSSISIGMNGMIWIKGGDIDLENSEWGNLDYLIIDMPPNTSDAPLSLIQLLDLDGFVLVTTPQHVAAVNTIRSGMMAKRLGVGLLGVIENMSDGKNRGGMEVSEALKCDFLGAVKMDYRLSQMSDAGKVAVLEEIEIKEAYEEIVKKLI